MTESLAWAFDFLFFERIAEPVIFSVSDEADEDFLARGLPCLEGLDFTFPDVIFLATKHLGNRRLNSRKTVRR